MMEPLKAVAQLAETQLAPTMAMHRAVFLQLASVLAILVKQ